MRNSPVLPILAFAVIASLAPLPAEAQGLRWQPGLGAGLDAAQADRALSGEALVRALRRQVEGKLLDILGRERREGRDVFLVRWLFPDGAIKTLVVDAETGRILE